MHKRSLVAFLGACSVLVALKVFFDLQPVDYALRDQGEAFTWQTVLIILAIGTAGFFADRNLHFPQPFEDSQRERRGLLWASLGGIAYGFITIANDVISRRRHPLANSDWEHVPLPWSIPFYIYGAIFLEFLLRLGALCILVWLVHRVILRGRFRRTVFWTANCFVALYEIFPYMQKDAQARDWLSVIDFPLQPLYFSNVFEGWLLLRFGWFAPIIFRISFYLIWHMLFGGLARSHFVH